MGGQILLGAPKSDAGRRALTMPQALADALAAHLDEHGLIDDDAVFVFAAPERQPASTA